MVLLPKETYVGERENRRYHGQGALNFRDGDKDVGEYKDGTPNGQGTFTWSNGRMYEGELKNGFTNCQGTYTNPDGIKYVGEFKDGRNWNTTEYDKNRNITGKYVNGIYIKQ